MKIADHTLKRDLDNYFKEFNIDRTRTLIFKAWPVISGPQLSAVTELKTIKNGILIVSTTSSSAKSLLLLKKKNIINKYNEMYPELNIVDLEIVKRS